MKYILPNILFLANKEYNQLLMSLSLQFLQSEQLPSNLGKFSNNSKILGY